MNIVLFDGICNFCNSTVLQIIKYDKANKLKFSSLQSDFGKKTLKSLKMEEDNLNTLIFIKNSNEVYTESTAILEIIKMLQGFPRVLLFFRIFPKKVRDFLYKKFSYNRYKLFGKKENCMIPTKELSEKFIDN
jgi:predicted DCC family thiol-disulfide oxidoreductase YuxK